MRGARRRLRLPQLTVILTGAARLATYCLAQGRSIGAVAGAVLLVVAARRPWRSWRLALDRAACLPDVLTVVDRLRVAPKRRFDDEQIRRRLLDLLVDEPSFGEYEFISSVRALARRRAHASSKPRIEFGVDDGIVTLRGRAANLLDRRMAGVLAWWVPGSRDVVNLLMVGPQPADSDDEM